MSKVWGVNLSSSRDHGVSGEGLCKMAKECCSQQRSVLIMPSSYHRIREVYPYMISTYSSSIHQGNNFRLGIIPLSKITNTIVPISKVDPPSPPFPPIPIPKQLLFLKFTLKKHCTSKVAFPSKHLINILQINDLDVSIQITTDH